MNFELEKGEVERMEKRKIVEECSGLEFENDQGADGQRIVDEHVASYESRRE